MELNPELELVVTVDVRPLRVDEGVEQDGSFYKTQKSFRNIFHWITTIFIQKQMFWDAMKYVLIIFQKYWRFLLILYRIDMNSCTRQ